MYCKTHTNGNNQVLACCDKELIGKNLKQGNYEVTIDEDFYKGKEVSEEKLKEVLKEAGNINLFGNKTVGIALKQGFLSEKDVITIKGVKHAIIMRL